MIRGSDWFSVAVRVVFLVVFVGTSVYLYNRYEVVEIEKGDDSMEIVVSQEGRRDEVHGYPGGALLLVDLHPSSVMRDTVIAYVTKGEIKDAQIVRVGRLLGIPGDRLAMGKNGLSINGNPVRVGRSFVKKIPEVLVAQGMLMDDQYLIFNTNENSLFLDGRSFGALGREKILGTVARNWPW